MKNFHWKQDVVYFQKEQEIQQIYFPFDSYNFIEDSFPRTFQYSTYLSALEPFEFFALSSVYSLLYLVNGDRVFVYCLPQSYPTHAFKPLLDQNEKIKAVYSFRKFLTEEQQET
jgi:hypothetical protein